MSLHEAIDELEAQPVRPSLLTSGARPLVLPKGGTWRGGVSFEPDGLVKAFGWPMCAADGGSAVSTIHSLTASSPFSTGGLTLDYGGTVGETAEIAYNSTAAAAEAIIEALGPDVEVTVTGGPLDSAPLVIDYDGAEITGQTIPLPIVNASLGFLGSAEITMVRAGHSSTAQKIDMDWHPVAPLATFEPIGLFSADACHQGLARAGTDYYERARSALEESTAFILAEELMTGRWSAMGPRPNPSLRSSAQIVTSAAANISEALAGLLAAWQGPYGARRATRPVAHVPWPILPLMEDHGMLQRQGSMFTTAGGTVLVSPGPGYDGYDPDGNPPAETDQFWVYLSGEVEYAVSDVFDRFEGVTPDHVRRNQDVQLAERAGIVVFDPSTVWAVPVDITP